MSTRRPVRSVVVRWLAAAAAGAALALTVAQPAAAQQPADPFQDRQLAYDAARSQYGAALDAWRVVEKQWNDAVEDHDQGRRAGDQDRQNTAITRALDVARELELSERRVETQRAALDRARTALLDALDDRIEQATAQATSARTRAERDQFTARLADYRNQQEEIEADRDQPAVRLQLLYYPTIVFDPRDTPQDLTGKAQLLRRKAEQADSALARIDREIVSSERRLRLQRNADALVSGVERFDPGGPPLGAPGRRVPPGNIPTRPDSAGVSRPEVTLDQRLDQLRLLRGQIEAAKQQFLQRAGDFEDAVRRIG
jgi:hypothetical protein